MNPDVLADEPAAPVGAVVALGANLGEPELTLQSAVDGLASFEGLRVLRVSPVYETAPVGPEQPNYLNAVLIVRTSLSPLALLAACQFVEGEHGRRRVVRWGPRTLDVDIVAYGDVQVRSPDLELPHPRAAERAFVLAPWADVDPAAALPQGRVSDLLTAALAAAPRDAVRRRPDVVLLATP